jgi:para-nitrobenzyl esterase
VLTDYMFSCPALSVSSDISKYVPVYVFEFNDPQAITTLKTPPGMDSMGSFHSSGLVYIFQTPLAGLGADPAQFSPAQRQLADAFSEAWATFAKTGDPNGQGQQRWPTSPTTTNAHSGRNSTATSQIEIRKLWV